MLGSLYGILHLFISQRVGPPGRVDAAADTDNA